MKYILMTYGGQEAWDAVGRGATGKRTLPQEQVDAQAKAMDAFLRELTESGEMVSGFGMADPTHTQTVDASQGPMMITDGPYAEAKEVLAGFLVVECESHQQASELAARFSSIVSARIEMRPLQED